MVDFYDQYKLFLNLVKMGESIDVVLVDHEGKTICKIGAFDPDVGFVTYMEASSVVLEAAGFKPTSYIKSEDTGICVLRVRQNIHYDE